MDDHLSPAPDININCLRPSQLLEIFKSTTRPSSVSYEDLPLNAQIIFEHLANNVIDDALRQAPRGLNVWDLMAILVTKLSVAILRTNLGDRRCGEDDHEAAWVMRNRATEHIQRTEPDFTSAVITMFLAINCMAPHKSVHALIRLYQAEVYDLSLSKATVDTNVLLLVDFLSASIEQMSWPSYDQTMMETKSKRRTYDIHMPQGWRLG